jgi:EAL domain-containing protein (putative c-di-GMP-specific phosphodiesterase class I)
MLELAAIRKALADLPLLPEDVYLAINASPETLLSEELAVLLEDKPAERIVLELTEHAHVADYSRLLQALRPLRQRGIRLAVDDAGAGYASLQHVLHLQPDLIKLEMSLTRNIDVDLPRRALASALIRFARDTGSRIIAEGVETASELSTLRSLGVEKAQGYFLGRPSPLRDIIATTNAAKVAA